MTLTMKSVAVLASGLLLTAPAFADPNASAKKDKDKLICKNETVIGSLIPGPRRCYTRDQWEEQARAGQAIARKVVESGTGLPTTN